MREATEAQAPVNYNRSFRRMLKDTSHSLSGGKLQSRGFPVDNCWITLDRFPHSRSSHGECGKGCVIDASFVLTADLLLALRSGSQGLYLLYLLRRRGLFVIDWLKKPHIRQDNGSQKREEMVFIFLSAWLIRQDGVGRARCGALSPDRNTLYCTHTIHRM